ncbi:MAG: hypothetical protein DWQ19_12675 [Crenarchaeota archaeon]|nr:MAG: hypothetical protein DWQ19_12675 [Thermoproteota archaeon]
MQYFVSIPNTAYYRWQAELLIESFKYHKLQNNLIIVINENKEPDLPEFKKNLLAHEQKYVYVNFGKQFNKIRSLIWALEEGKLQKPFTLLHPDMLLLKPVEIPKESVLYDINTNFNAIEPFVKNRIKELFSEHNSEGFTKIPLGDTLIFNKDVPNSLFVRMHHELKKLVGKFGDVKHLERAAWLLAIYNEIIFEENDLTIRGDSLEQGFEAHNVYRNIIHYKHGIAPEFNKKHYLYEPPMFMATHGLNPFDAIYENNVTTSTNFAYDLIERYRNI